MINIKKSETADTRTCDWSKVTKEQLLRASRQHIDDVHRGLRLLAGKLLAAAEVIPVIFKSVAYLHVFDDSPQLPRLSAGVA